MPIGAGESAASRVFRFRRSRTRNHIRPPKSATAAAHPRPIPAPAAALRPLESSEPSVEGTSVSVWPPLVAGVLVRVRVREGDGVAEGITVLVPTATICPRSSMRVPLPALQHAVFPGPQQYTFFSHLVRDTPAPVNPMDTDPAVSSCHISSQMQQKSSLPGHNWEQCSAGHVGSVQYCLATPFRLWHSKSSPQLSPGIQQVEAPWRQLVSRGPSQNREFITSTPKIRPDRYGRRLACMKFPKLRNVPRSAHWGGRARANHHGSNRTPPTLSAETMPRV
jgi:hypothetical protein